MELKFSALEIFHVQNKIASEIMYDVLVVKNQED